MAAVMLDRGSLWRGLRAWRPGRGRVNYAVRRHDQGVPHQGGRFWLYAWTPFWHEGRGPYLSVGLGWFAVYRGY